ncbi:hypothetical protein B9Z19DRAFT_1118105 [Tuber borchii]|uniref:Uncharacterized protein n=1 Tax=Tuber borchii TaxID=42251 RepID=A0A2T7A926_TUBBO|nr:hypothetical protein B9Z19DRAFT_1118105 [Tuber borchii]
MNYNRSLGRDIHIYSAKEPDLVLGGLILASGMTNTNFYAMVEIVFIFTTNFTLRHRSGVVITRDDGPIQPGDYFIVSAGTCATNNEALISSLEAIHPGARDGNFRTSVRDRDRRCVITETPVNERQVECGFRSGINACHIFPIAHNWLWENKNYGRWVKDNIDDESEPSGSINSVRNGILLRSDVHDWFNNYTLSIDPDDGYKIVAFNFDSRFGRSGARLNQAYVQSPDAPSKHLLRLHYRQAVLVNVRGGS